MANSNLSLLILSYDSNFLIESWTGYHIIHCTDENEFDNLIGASLYQNVILANNFQEQRLANKKIRGTVLTLENAFRRFSGEMHVQIRNVRTPIDLLNDFFDEPYTIH